MTSTQNLNHKVEKYLLLIQLLKFEPLTIKIINLESIVMQKLRLIRKLTRDVLKN